jgi:MFS family permease
MLVALLTVGRLITKIGRYRIFPIIGTSVLIIGLWLFSHVAVNTSQLTLSVWMVITGLGIGSFMQVMTLAVQNSIHRSEMGTATSTITFFRSMGSAFGTAIFGAILVNRLTYNLKLLLPHTAATGLVSINNLQTGAMQVKNLPPNVSQAILEAFARSFHVVFLWGIPFGVLALIAALFLRESPLSDSTRDMAAGEGLKVN